MDNYKVLRASKIGSLCDRALFYSVNGAEEITSEKSLRRNPREYLKSAEFLNPSSFSGYAMTAGMLDVICSSIQTRE